MPPTIRQLFYEDVREKKRTASGVHSKTGIRGYVGKVHTPDSLLKGKEKRKYRGNSKVRSYNMYTTIMPIDEFEQLDQERQKELLENWRNFHSNHHIIQQLGVNNQTFYDMVNDLNIPKKTKGKDYSNHKNKGEKPDIIEYADFLQKSEDEQKEILSSLFEKYTRTELKEEWKLNSYRFYNHLKQLGFVKRRKSKQKDAEEVETKTLNGKSKEPNGEASHENGESTDQDMRDYVLTLLKKVEELENKNSQFEEKSTEEKEEDGFTIELEGEYDTKTIVNRVTHMMRMLQHEEGKYRIDLKLTEKK